MLLVRHHELAGDLAEAIAAAGASVPGGAAGSANACPTSLRADLADQLLARGFAPLVETVSVPLMGNGRRAVAELEDLGFVRDRVVVQARFGTAAEALRDIAAFQILSDSDRCDVGVEIVPCHGLHAQMSSGVSYGEQLIYDIERLKRHFPAVPVKVILVDID